MSVPSRLAAPTRHSSVRHWAPTCPLGCMQARHGAPLCLPPRLCHPGTATRLSQLHTSGQSRRGRTELLLSAQVFPCTGPGPPHRLPAAPAARGGELRVGPAWRRAARPRRRGRCPRPAPPAAPPAPPAVGAGSRAAGLAGRAVAAGVRRGAGARVEDPLLLGPARSGTRGRSAGRSGAECGPAAAWMPEAPREPAAGGTQEGPGKEEEAAEEEDSGRGGEEADSAGHGLQL